MDARTPPAGIPTARTTGAYDSDGTGLGASSSLGRDDAETALGASEERLRLAVAATGLGIFDWDLTTDLVTVNARFREMFALPPGDVIGASMLGGVVHPDDRAFVEAKLGEAFDPRSSGAYQFEHRAITPHGELWLLTFGQVYFAGEGSERRAVRVIGNDLDITPRKRVEAERERLLAEREAALRALEAANDELQSTTAELGVRTATAEQAASRTALL